MANPTGKGLPKGSPRQLKVKQAEAKERVITLIAAGHSVAASMKAVERSAATYQMWRSSDASFKHRIDVIRQGDPDNEAPDDFVTFRRTYFAHDTYWHQHQIIDAIEGAEPMSITMILLPPEWGKLLPDSTPMPTPQGWRKMGDLDVGDTVFGRDGKWARITSVHTEERPDLRKVRFTDGTSIECCVDHRWLTRTREGRQPKVRTTAEIERTLRTSEGRPNHAIPVCEAVQMPEADLPIDPYVLGYWLGDGNSADGRFTCHPEDQPHLYERLIDFDPRPGSHPNTVGTKGLYRLLREQLLLGGKRIPTPYLRASERQRRELLAGLMDSDGYAGGHAGQVELTLTRGVLMEGAEELVRSLGYKPAVRESDATLNGRVVGRRWRLRWVPDQQVFSLPRKKAMWREPKAPTDRLRWRMIESVEPIPSEPGRCITVDNEDHLYLAGRDFLVTHNTTTLEDYICYKLGPVDPNLRFCILSEAQSHARKIIGRISRRMTDRVLNPNYIDMFGPFKPPDREQQKPWNADQITIVHNTSDERDPSVEVKSAGSAIYGARYDVIVLDDIQSTKNINQTPQLLEYFRQDVLTRAGQTGKIIIIGTRVGPGDFYEKLLEEIPEINLVLITALDDQGRSNFPEVEAPDGRKIGWGEPALAKRRAMVGEETWFRVYMQQPQSAAGAVFTTEVIDQAKDKTRTIWLPEDRNGTKQRPPVPGLDVIGMLDPALAGHCVHRIASYDFEHFYLMDGRNSKGLTRYSQIWDLIEELTIKWHPSVWVIEGNSLQGGIITDDRLVEMEEKYGFRVEAHQTGKNKADETIGVASMEGAFKRREISIPWGDAETRENFAALPVELDKWRSDIPTKYLTQDEVMALWFGYLYWQRVRATLAVKVNQRVITRGLPYTPTAYPYARSNA